MPATPDPASAAAPDAGDAHVPVVEIARPNDLQVLSHGLAGEEDLFVPEPKVPEVPAAIFLKDVPDFDPSLFADVPAEERPAAAPVEQTYAGLAFEDVFLSPTERKRAIAALRGAESEDAQASEPVTIAPVEPAAAAILSDLAQPADDAAADDVLAALETPATEDGVPAMTIATDAPPVLGAELLGLIGDAAHQAGLEAFDALDERKAPQPSRPAQDEWGLFDPSQAGADALFVDEGPANRLPPPRSGRTVGEF